MGDVCFIEDLGLGYISKLMIEPFGMGLTMQLYAAQALLRCDVFELLDDMASDAAFPEWFTDADTLKFSGSFHCAYASRTHCMPVLIDKDVGAIGFEIVESIVFFIIRGTLFVDEDFFADGEGFFQFVFCYDSLDVHWLQSFQS